MNGKPICYVNFSNLLRGGFSRHSYENFNALDGGPDGLRVARLILDLACIHLHPDGKLWMELGSDHPPLVKTIIAMQYEDRLRYIAGHKDQYDRERFVEIMKI